MKIAFLPIDNRPVCYTLPELISRIDASVEFSIPDRQLLGDLKKNADIDGIFEWLKQLPPQDAIVISLDTIAYGGLIPSRRSPETFCEIKQRIANLKEILKAKKAKIYAFSSIMRISDNYYNEEEKEYWSKWGREIFKYSYDYCKNNTPPETNVPQEILKDYIETRRRNFEINKIYLQWQKEGIFDTLIFSKDDCAQYGFNVQEAQELETLGGYTKTGADEIPLSLLARSIGGEVKIHPVFSESNSKDLISNYEDVSVEKSVLGQIELAGCKVSDKETADIILYVNNFVEKQGEIVMKIDTEAFNSSFVAPAKRYMIADVRFANGADNKFVDVLLKNNLKENFFGYSAWNTTANSLGSLICGAKFKYLSKEYDDTAFKKLQFVRFTDDWGYQANVRQALATPDEEQLSQNIKPYEMHINELLGTDFKPKYSFPWKRLFEVEIWI